VLAVTLLGLAAMSAGCGRRELPPSVEQLKEMVSRGEGLYEGTVEYTARLSADGWRIEELRLPHSGWRTTLKDGIWQLVRR